MTKTQTGRLRNLLPSRADYRLLPRNWGRDLVAGITVGIVALPLALAFAISSGASPEMGLVTAVIAGFVAAVFGGSNVQVSGPTGAMVVILLPIAVTHGMLALPIVAIMGGIIVVVAGVLRLGRTVSFIPWPVIEGFTAGIAVIIFLQQVPAVLGTTAGKSTNTLIATVQSFATVSSPGVLWAVAAAGLTVIIMLVARRIHPIIPGSIIAIIIVTVLVEVTAAPVARIGELPSSLPAPSLPAVDIAVLGSLIMPAFAVAALTAIESLLSARVASGMDGAGPYDGDRELVGQGLAGIASGLFGGMPATGAIARTAVNVRSGARTRMASIVHAGFLAVVVYTASGVIGRIPLVALAGVLVMTSINMIDYKSARRVLRVSRADAIIFMTTAIVTVTFDLIFAVLIGVAVTALFAIRSMSRASEITRDSLPGPREAGDNHIALLRFRGALFFGLGDRVLSVLEGTRDIDVVILRLSQLRMLDSSGGRVLAELVTVLEKQGITVFVKGLPKEHERVARSTGVLESDETYVVSDLNEAVSGARALVKAKRISHFHDETDA